MSVHVTKYLEASLDIVVTMTSGILCDDAEAADAERIVIFIVM
jgi:hypothetical protein